MKKKCSLLFFILGIIVNMNAQKNPVHLSVYYTNKATTIKYTETDYNQRVIKGYVLAEVVDGGGCETTVTENGSKYLIERVFGSEPELFQVSKADVDIKLFEISPFPVSMIGNGLNFATSDGLKARVFKSNSNGHKYMASSYSKELGTSLSSCYVLCMECINEYDGKKNYVENPVAVKNGNILNDGIFPIVWASGLGSERSSYDKTGKLLYNQRCDFDGQNLIVAYIGSEKALYFDGKFYYLVDSSTQSTAGARNESSTAQTLDDLPISDILKLIEYEGDYGDILKNNGYKYVGEYSTAACRCAISTWCRNCTASKSGDVLQFQKGTSCIVCHCMAMGDYPTLTIEVFNINARDIIVNELRKIGFVENGGDSNQRYFSRENVDYGTDATLVKTKKGWKFSLYPVAS
ncbi:MAG: hypothetical protein J5529_09980 [Prevotella sp.]|nr:hypothetical protein [Prevotella sp.]